MQKQVVGRQRELELVRAALASGAHILLEGPPGTGKSTLLRQVAASRHTEFVLVEGSAELTPARLVGSFDPALVLEQGYRPENFSDGPLVRAMREGGLLYVEERSEEHTSELQSHSDLVCRLLLEKKKKKTNKNQDNSHEKTKKID